MSQKTSYQLLNIIPATSNIVERLFSWAKLVITDQRNCLSAVMFSEAGARKRKTPEEEVQTIN